MASQSRRQALTQARRLFTQQGAVPGNIVAEPILRSWRRCADLGFDMRGPRRQEPMTQSELREVQQRHDALRRLCAPAMSQLRSQAHFPESLVILTDAHGLVLDSSGDPVFANRASRVALMPGAPWDEAAAGTNAIGMALVEGRAISVHGAEHFFEPNHILTCAAVPITDPQGRAIGVLDLSGQARANQPHALDLVRQAVEDIEYRLFAGTYGHCTLLHLHTDPTQVDAPWACVMAFEGELLVAANRYAQAALSIDGSAFGVYRYGDLFEGIQTPDAHHASFVRSHIGTSFYARRRDPPVRALRRSETPIQAPPKHEVTPAAVTCFDATTLAALARAVHLSDAGISLLLQGETGVGKEVFARQVHARGKRARGPFVAVNCAALPDSLIESELFGYEEGAFTGARRQGSKGLLRQAHGGVLFLDEIGDMPLAAQARLLRVLQAREVTPLGGAQPVAIDFVLICATHRAVGQPGNDAALRPDLYFRIAEYTVTLTPLRARQDRLELLQSLWSAQGAGPALPQAVEARLASYEWPGNYRQMSALLRTLKVLAQPSGIVHLEMLPPEMLAARVATPSRTDAASTLQSATDLAIRDALAASGGNISLAARALGVHRSTLYRRAAALRE